MLFITCLIAMTLPWPGHTVVTPIGNYPHMIQLVDMDKVTLFWKHDDTEITFEMHVKTTGWVALGISPDGGMAGSDIFLGWVTDKGYIGHDRYAVGTSTPRIDSKQDWRVLHAEKRDTFTIFIVKRKMVNCDPNEGQDRAIEYGTTRLIYAWGFSDPGETGIPSYHGGHGRGTRSLVMVNPSHPAPNMPDDVIVQDIRVSNARVPVNHTNIWCEIVPIMPLSSKHHVIRIEPLIQPGNEGLVYQMIMDACFGEIDSSLVNKGHVCYQDEVMNNIFSEHCTSLVFSWAIGAGHFNFPEHAGYAFTTGDHTPKYMRMELYYDNPEHRTDLVDSSGLRVYMTPTLRQYDADVLQVGAWTSRIAVPPRFDEMTYRSYCMQNCLSQGMGNTEEINIFAVFHHSHMLSRGMKLRHVRTGVEQPVISKEPYYDYNIQDYQNLKQEIKVRKGDNMVLECTYKSSHLTTWTQGGRSIRNEMCLAFMMYYPKVALTECNGASTRKNTMSFAGEVEQVGEEWVMKGGQYAGKNLAGLMTSVDWSQKSNRDNFQNGILTGEIDVMCKETWWSNYPMHGTQAAVPQITHPRGEEVVDTSVCSNTKTPKASIISTLFFGMITIIIFLAFIEV